MRDNEQIREQVRAQYSKTALGQGGCCGPSASGCCDGLVGVEQIGQRIGYQAGELASVPEGANLGLGCGNPTAIDAIVPGETVLDLGSGAGMDVFLAAKQVGPAGRVIGVDMTPAMVEKAKANAVKAGVTNVEFRSGLIEALPVEDESVDGVISNCVINLSPEKEKVFAEAFRVLKNGGRLMVSDIVLEKPLAPVIAESMVAYAGCVAGASLREEYLQSIRDAGFTDLKITKDVSAAGLLTEDNPLVQEAMGELNATVEQVRAAMDSVRSIGVFARKMSV